jgi:UDP-3-O-[3-hydroxymyristoyl] glucosamine N-acyltransferase
MQLLELVAFTPSLEVVQNADFHALTFDVRNLLPKTLTYCGGVKYLQSCLERSDIAAVMTSRPVLEEYTKTASIPASKGIVLSNAPKYDFFTLHNHLADKTDFYKRSNKSSIGAGCTIGKLASIDAHNVVIGDNVVIEDFVRIGANTTIGSGTVIRSGTVIGGDGFQFMRLSSTVNNDATILKIAHAGGVRIGADVELQASCMIDKHIFGGNTVIDDTTKCADGVHIAHCARVGKRCLVAAGAIVLGSTVVGDDVWIGPGAVISNELDVGDEAFITLGAVVTKNVARGEKLSGNFAIPHSRFLEHLRSIR